MSGWKSAETSWIGMPNVVQFHVPGIHCRPVPRHYITRNDMELDGIGWRWHGTGRHRMMLAWNWAAEDDIGMELDSIGWRWHGTGSPWAPSKPSLFLCAFSTRFPCSCLFFLEKLFLVVSLSCEESVHDHLVNHMMVEMDGMPQLQVYHRKHALIDLSLHTCK